MVWSLSILMLLLSLPLRLNDMSNLDFQQNTILIIFLPIISKLCPLAVTHVKIFLKDEAGENDMQP